MPYFLISLGAFHNGWNLFRTGPFLLSAKSRTEGYGDNSSLPYLARHFDLLQVLETDWPRVWDDGNEEDSSFLEGMLEEQFKVLQSDTSAWIRDMQHIQKGYSLGSKIQSISNILM